MKLNQRSLLLTGAFLLLFSLACAVPTLPFLGGGEEAAPAPVVDEASIETMIADAAALKVTQTLEALPPTATATATPTETPLPSPTATEIPPTSTPTKEPYPETGSALEEALEEMEEGGTRYQDYTGGYEINIPAEWLAIRPGEQEYTQAWSLPAASDPTVRNSLQQMQSLDPNLYRLFALDIREGHYSNGFLTKINFVLSLESEASLEEIFAQSILDLPEAIPGAVVTDTALTETETGIPYGLIESERELQTEGAELIQLYQQQAIFTVQGRPLVITFTSTTEDLSDEVVQEFEIMLNSFNIIE